MSGREALLQQLETACRQLLSEFPEGLSEHALMQCLRQPPYELLPTLALDDSLGLFQSHFLLFHVLYRLRDRLRSDKDGELSISPLLIRLQAYVPGEAALHESDPLRDYYLDLEQLQATDAEAVEKLLSGFHQRLSAENEKEHALTTLQLQEPVSMDEVRRQYRRLAMQHHPDRGGDAETMHALNSALSILQRCLR